MNNIVNLSQLINRLAKVTDTDPNTARRFLRAFFASIEDTLAEGETVEIKGIGTFRRCDDPAVGTPGTVGFAPAEDFAEEINRPFAVFEAVELADGITAEDLEPETDDEAAEESQPVQPAAQEPETTQETEETKPVAETHEEEAEAEEEHKAPWEIYGKDPFFPEEKEPEKEEETITEPETPVQNIENTETETPDEDIEPENEPEEEAEEETESEQPRSKAWIWITAAIVLVAAIGGYFAAVVAVPIPTYGEDEEEETTQIESTAESTTEPVAEATETETASTMQETAPTEPAATETPAPKAEETPAPTPAKEPKYDTVTQKRYLAIMAREYYGRSVYWVFIYEANKDKLGDPNKVAPGTRVVIPDKASLPGATDAERLSIAEKKAAQIQARFK